MSLHTPLAARRAFGARRQAMRMNRTSPVVELLEKRTLLSQGPWITAITPTEVINATFDHVDVSWNEPIDPSTFTTDDVMVTAPPGTGAVAPTGVTELTATSYRISFNALSDRGTYQIGVGPNIADLQGDLMDQNQNGIGGEPSDQFQSSLTYVVAQTVFTSDTVISETNNTYDGQDIAIKGATVTIDGPHSFDSVHLIDGAVLTHSADSTTQTHELDLTVTEQVIVDASSRIDVTGDGYVYGHTTGNTTVGGATGWGGGSYGGLGGSHGGSFNAPYGDYTAPDDWGSGSGVTSGGGLVWITATALELDGKILADGYSGSGGGSGGGIDVTVTSLTGSGQIRAAGGYGGANGNNGSGGGGGRVAVTASDMTGFGGSITAPGGTGPGSGGAGTVYIRDPNQPSGTLIIDDGTTSGTTPLGLPGQTTFTIPDTVVIRGAQTLVQPEHTGLVLEFQNSLTVDQSATLNVEAAGFVTDQAPTVLGGATLNVSGDYAPTLPPVVTGASLNVSGDLTLAVPLQVTNSGVSVDGMITSTVPQTISGGTITTDHLVAPTWSLVQGAVLTSFASTTTQMHELEVQIDGTLSIDATSSIDVTGDGYLAGYTTGNTTTGGATGFSGGSYGGLAPGSTNKIYGDYAQPDDWGSGGGESPGGGLIQIMAGTMTLDGRILADAPGGHYVGSGGGILIEVTTLSGNGSVRASGGAGNGDGFGTYCGGGGRIAVYANDFSGFATAHITAPGGHGSNSGGTGTVYLRDPDESNGTLIIDAGSGGSGATPLGLPGQTSFTIPDAVVIRGAQTHVQPEHVGLALEFQSGLTVDQSATLDVEAAGFVTDQAPTVLGGATLNVSGDYAPTLPPVVTGASLNVSGDLTLAVPLQVTNSGVSVDGMITSTVPQTITGGTITTDHLVAPTWSLVQGAVLTSFASTTTQMHELEVQIDGTLSIDATSSIDVTGDGYLAGYTTGNTTTGGATGFSGGSYGGLAPGSTNKIYGDYAQPDDWGSGGGGSPGGGLIQIMAGTMTLDGRILADAPGGHYVGSGGGILIEVTTLSGNGSVRASGGGGNGDGFNTYCGGGGRIAVYANDLSGFATAHITAPGGSNGPNSGGPGTVWIVQGQPHTHVQAYFPYGVEQGFVDHGNGYVSSSIDSITLRFSNSIDLSSFDPSQFLIDGQMGRIVPTGIEQVDDRTYRIDLPFPLTENGPYSFTLRSIALKDTQGFPLDQNANGIPGEPLDDDYSFTLVVDTVPPHVSNQDPAGDVAGTIDHVDVWFSEAIDTATFTTGDVTIVKPDATTVAATGIQNVGLNEFQISFPAQTLVGIYHVKIGPSVTDLAGNGLDENGNGIGGEATDVYDGTFNLVNVDLGLSNVTVQPSQLWAGDSATISWSGQNLTGLPLQGTWADTVYLSTDNQWDINDTLLATVTHTGGLAQNQTYTGSATVVLPGVLPGNYHILVRADVANQEKEVPDKANNLADSGLVAIGVHELMTDGTPVTGTLSLSDPADYYTLHVDGGQNLGLVLNGQAASGGNELYVSLNVIPTRQAFELGALTGETRLDNQNQRLALTAPPGGGTYYILVYGAEISTSNNPYTLSATTGPLVLTEISPSRASNQPPPLPPGVVSTEPILPSTITISGAGFTQGTSVEFVAADGTVYSPTNPVVISPSTMTVDLTLLAMPAGYYDVRVTKGTASITKPQAFVVTTGASHLETNLIVPGMVGELIPIRQTIWIEYKNTGDAAMPAPLLMLHGDHGALMTTDPDLAIPFYGYSNYPAGVSDTIQVIGTGSGATPGILQPGDSGRIAVYYIGLGVPADHPVVTFTLSRLTADDVSWQTSTVGTNGSVTTTGEDWDIDWATLAGQLQPASIPDDAWSVIAANLQTQLGTEWGDYIVQLDADLDAFFGAGQQFPNNVVQALGSTGTTGSNPPGQNPQDVAALWNFEVLKASDAYGPISTLDSEVDASLPTPGLPLTFTRTYGASIESRFDLGSLGRGWHSNWDIEAETQSNGDVVVRGPGGADRYFIFDRGSYRPSPGDFGQLTLSNGTYRLTETDQTVWQFRADGKLDYVQDTNDNRITLGYNNAGQLASLTHSDGQQLLLAYDSDGRLISLTEPLGPGTADDRVWTYQYDSLDEHLVSVTAPGNRITTYTYASGQVPAQAHALTSITDPGGVITNFAYDDRGRLVGTSGAAGADAVQFVYDDLGTVTVIDATSRKATLSYGIGGDLLQVRDGLGDTTQYTYNEQMELTQVVGPMGETYNYTYDAKGNVVGISDPLSDQTSFAYDPTFNQLSSFTDARGNGMQYAYDSNGNLSSITYADGTKETYIYDAQGDVLTSTDRRGQTLKYTYNSAGQVTSKDDLTTLGVDYLYTYDAAGNLTSYTDPTGTTKMTYDPNTDDLLRIDYTGGQYFVFAYDADDRRISQIDQDGNVENYAYDSLGRLQTLTDGGGALIASYEYDDAGRTSLKTLGNGVYTTYDYDAAGNVLHLINQEPDGSVLSEYDYTYDASGRRTSMQTVQNDGSTIDDSTQTYGYDPLGQLTSVDYSDGTSQLYVYDAAGNRVKVIDNGVETDYTTNNLNQYTQVGDMSYTYDTDGNMKTQTEGGVTTTYSYDAQNQLIGVATPTDTWTYTYNALGNRVASSQNGVVTKFVIDPIGLGNLAAEYDGSGKLIARYDYGYGLTSQIQPNGAAYYYTFSAIGNTSELTGAQGVVVNSYAYDPFGISQSRTKAVANPFEYVGEFGVTDESSGLQFMRARFVTTSLGRFLQNDPMGIQGGLNVFAYAGNNPSSHIDPLGLFCWLPLVYLGNWIIENWDTIDPGIDAAGEFIDNGLPQHVLTDVITSWDNGLDDLARWSLDPQPEYPSAPWNPSDPGQQPPPFNFWPRPEYRPPTNPPDPEQFNIHNSGPTPHIPPFQPPVPPTGDPQNQQSQSRHTADPNDKLAPGGFGDAAYIQADSSLDYEVRFENESDATAPARLVTVTDVLDPNVDLSTFELTEIEFANHSITIPTGLDSYDAMVPMTTPTGASIVVDVQAKLDRAARTLSLVLQALDPTTGWYSDDPEVGLLYPEDGTNRGVGSISYLVKPLAGLASSTVIENRAKIVFDYNDPINTPLVHNALDAGSPTSQVNPLGATTTDTTFAVSWSGQDEANGSGIANYDLYVSVDGGTFFPLLTGTTDTSTSFSGLPGHTYSFDSVATDNVGHVEDPPSVPDATIQIVGAATTTTLQSSENPSKFGDPVTFRATVSPADSANGTPTGSVQFSIDGATVGDPVPLDGNGEATFTTSSLAVGSHTVTADYINTDGNFNPSGGTLASSQVVTTADTLAVVGSSAPTTVYGQSVTFTATVSAITAGLPTPTGAVEFFDGTTELDTETLDNTGTAAFTTSALVAGTHSITVQYLGDSNFTGSNSTAFSQTVNQASTTTALASGPSPSVFGQMVTFTATVLPVAPGGGTPTGTVQFQVDGADFGTPVELVDGQAVSTSTATLPAGGHTINAIYSGDTEDTASSTTASETVSKAHLTVTAAARSKSYGALVPTLTDTITGFVSGDTASVVSGTASLNTTATAASGVGSYPITIAVGSLTAANYDFPNLIGGTLIITPAPLRIQADDQIRAAGQPNPPLTASYFGFVNGDGPSSLASPVVLSTSASATSPAGAYPINAGGASSPDYTITFQSGTLTVTPISSPPPPRVTVESLQVEKIKVGKGKKAKKETVLVLQLSGALNAGAAGNVNAYELAPVITVKAKGKGKHKQPATTKLGAPVTPASAVYTGANNQVTLTPRGTLKLTKPEELIVKGALVTDALGRPIDGNHDGQSGGDYIATISGSRVTVGGLPLARTREQPATALAAIDALLARGELTGLTRSRLARSEAGLAAKAFDIDTGR